MVLAATAVPPYLVEVVALIGAAAVVAYVCQRLGLLPIVGFLLAGVLIGPHALGLVREPATVEAAAELGVLLLLFTIGIEFSLDKLARIRRLIFVGGGLQVVLVTAAVAGLLAAFGVDWRAGVFSGFLVALSSTAIVIKLLGDRNETATEAGQAVVGLLIFQDLAVIVMVLLVPALGGEGGAMGSVAWALAKAALILVFVLVVARRLMPPLLEAVARTCSPELFLLTVIAICFGTAFAVGLAGVSLSLGAFLAGLVVSQSRFAEHAFSEILPLQILFSAVFFVSVGMLFDVRFMLASPLLVLAVVAVVLLVKLATTGAAVRALGLPAATAASAAILLAQVGEFSFVLERAGRAVGLTPMGMGESGSQSFIAASVLLMVATPFLAPLAGRIARRGADSAPSDTPEPATEAEALEEDTRSFEGMHDHVVVAGYGERARPLARALRRADVPFVVATLSPSGAREAESEGHPVLRGDYTKRHILERVGLDRARLLVVPDDQPAMAHRVASVARALAPDVRVVVHAPAHAAAELVAHTDHVVSDEYEGVVGLLGAVLRGFEHAPEQIVAHEDALRAAPYASLLPERPVLAGTPDLPSASPMRIAFSPEVPVTLTPDPAVPCGHAEWITPVTPGSAGCAECLASGDRWVHLRICMTCGHVGCCDSSVNKHATAHYHGTGHPVMRSLEPGETWGWCYVDEVTL